jgi:hypothetical protein
VSLGILAYAETSRSAALNARSRTASSSVSAWAKLPAPSVANHDGSFFPKTNTRMMFSFLCKIFARIPSAKVKPCLLNLASILIFIESENPSGGFLTVFCFICVPLRSSEPPTVRLSGSAVICVPLRSSQPPTVRLSGSAVICVPLR